MGAQVYVSRRGECVADLAVGEARPGEALGRDMLMLWLSSTKPIAAVAVGQLWERGKLELDDPVARFIPEFGVQGKEGITLRHLLTHTAGIRGTAATWTPRPWEQVIEHICNSRIEPEWVPGQTAGYHLASSWYILGEIIRRVDGRAFCDYVRQEIFLPLGMTDCWVGMPAEQFRAYGGRLATMYQTHKGGFDAQFAGNGEEGVTSCRPGANGRGPVRQLGRFYEMLLNRGEKIISAQTVEALTARHRVGLFDHTFKRVLDWGLGFIPNNRYQGTDIPYGYGPHASMRAFGHSGQQSSVGLADPEHGLVVAIAFNGMPGEGRHNQRIREVLGAVYEDVGEERHEGA